MHNARIRPISVDKICSFSDLWAGARLATAGSLRRLGLEAFQISERGSAAISFVNTNWYQIANRSLRNNLVTTGARIGPAEDRSGYRLDSIGLPS